MTNKELFKSKMEESFIEALRKVYFNTFKEEITYEEAKELVDEKPAIVVNINDNMDTLVYYGLYILQKCTDRY